MNMCAGIMWDIWSLKEPTCSCGSRWVLLARMLNAVSGRFTVSL